MRTDFDPFPFPVASTAQEQAIRALEELDAHRKRVLAEHAHLTLTGLYNVHVRHRGRRLGGAARPGGRPRVACAS